MRVLRQEDVSNPPSLMGSRVRDVDRVQLALFRPLQLRVLLLQHHLLLVVGREDPQLLLHDLDHSGGGGSVLRGWRHGGLAVGLSGQQQVPEEPYPLDGAHDRGWGLPHHHLGVGEGRSLERLDLVAGDQDQDFLVSVVLLFLVVPEEHHPLFLWLEVTLLLLLLGHHDHGVGKSLRGPLEDRHLLLGHGHLHVGHGHHEENGVDRGHGGADHLGHGAGVGGRVERTSHHGVDELLLHWVLGRRDAAHGVREGDSALLHLGLLNVDGHSAGLAHDRALHVRQERG